MNPFNIISLHSVSDLQIYVSFNAFIDIKQQKNRKFHHHVGVRTCYNPYYAFFFLFFALPVKTFLFSCPQCYVGRDLSPFCVDPLE